MKKCVIIPDSFKGTMSSAEVCHIMEDSVKRFSPDCETVVVPVADGGEGTVDCFLQILKGNKIIKRVKGPFLEEIESFYGIIGDIAVIEMAATAGFTLAGENPDPSVTSTYGVGELVADAISKGCKQIILGLGGSATNDGGAGVAAALGTKFFDANGDSFLPTGRTLEQVVRIDNDKTKTQLKNIKVRAMCDIDNPFYGKNGAAYVFAPQKGANDVMVKLLDENLRSFAKTIEESLHVKVQTVKGGGAAGGMGAGAYAFLGAKLEQGIDVVLDLIDFEAMIEGSDYVFTGEGKLDAQSLGGKVVVGVGKRAKLKNVPVIAVVGYKEGEIAEIYELGVTKIFSVTQSPTSMEIIKNTCRQELSKTMERVLSEI